MALLTIVNSKGHTTLEYDTKTDEVEEARKTFDEMMEKGFVGFADGIPTTEFDPNAELITVAPLITGG